MKIDIDYLKGLLDAFQAAEKPTTDIEELKNRGFDYTDDKFIFHFQIFEDRRLIEGEDGGRLGHTTTGGGSVVWSVLPLRLTANGHDFIEALDNKQVWETIKSEFKDASIGTLLKIAKELFEGYVKNKVAGLIGG